MRSLSRLGIFGYVVLAIPVTGTSAAISTLVPPFYAEALGVSLSSVGLVFFLLRFFDAVTDPAMGWLLDRRPFAREHKPWVAISLPLFLVSIALLFRPVEAWVGLPYLMVAGFLAYAAYTIGLVTHQAWGAALADDAGELSRLMGYREIAVIVGILGVFAAPAIAESLGYVGLEAKVGAASGYLIACVLVFGPITLLAAPDDREATAGSPISFGEVRSFLARRDFLWLSTANFATNFATVSLSVITYFIAAYLFDAPDRYGLGMTIYFVAAFLGMPFWMGLARRIGDARALLVAFGYVGFGVASIPFWTALAFESRYLVFMALLGLGFGGPPYLIRSLIGQYAQAHERDTGRSVRGSAYAVTTFFDKLGSGVAAGAVLPILEWLRFDPEGGGGEVGREALLLVATTAPVFGFVVAVTATFLAARNSESA